MNKRISIIVCALLSAATPYAVSAATTAGPVTCADGTTAQHAGKGACSHHGGVKQDAAAAAKPADHSSKSNTSGAVAQSSPSTMSATHSPAKGNPTAKCKDGSLSYATNHTGACGHHGGVAEWLSK